MANTYVSYTGDGATTSFTVPFPYIDESDVIVTVDGVAETFSFLSSNVISISPAPSELAVVYIKRSTERDDRLVDFNDGAVLSEADLDLANLQLFYLIQESLDRSDIIIDSATEVSNILATVQQYAEWAYRYERLAFNHMEDAQDAADRAAISADLAAAYLSQLLTLGASVEADRAQVESWHTSIESWYNTLAPSLETVAASVASAQAAAEAAALSAATIASVGTVAISAFVGGKPTTSELIFTYVVPAAFSLPTNLGGSYVVAGTAATASTEFLLEKNGSSVGTLTFAAAGDVATAVVPFTTFAAGDTLSLVAPAAVDATLQDISISLVGSRM